MNRIDDILVSIVVPVYNSEKYISSCVNSVLIQSHQNLQIILIDDGSTDSSSSICDGYLIKDRRIIVKHKNNGGVSSARNVGIKLSVGKYICFLDSDDIYHPKFIETMVLNAEKHNADMVVCNYKTFLNDNECDCAKFENKISILKADDVAENIICNDKFGGYPFNKLFLTSIVKGISFKENISFKEDMVFCLEYVENVYTCIYLDDPLYYYRINQSGASRGAFNLKKVSSIIADQFVLNYIKEKQLNQTLFINVYCEFYFSCATYFLRLFFSRINGKRRMKKDIVSRFYQSKERNTYLRSKKWSFKQRIEIACFNLLKVFYK